MRRKRYLPAIIVAFMVAACERPAMTAERGADRHQGSAIGPATSGGVVGPGSSSLKPGVIMTPSIVPPDIGDEEIDHSKTTLSASEIAAGPSLLSENPTIFAAAVKKVLSYQRPLTLNALSAILSTPLRRTASPDDRIASYKIASADSSSWLNDPKAYIFSVYDDRDIDLIKNGLTIISLPNLHISDMRCLDFSQTGEAFLHSLVLNSEDEHFRTFTAESFHFPFINIVSFTVGKRNRCLSGLIFTTDKVDYSIGPNGGIVCTSDVCNRHR